MALSKETALLYTVIGVRNEEVCLAVMAIFTVC